MPFQVFDVHAEDYDRWFDDNPEVFRVQRDILWRCMQQQGFTGVGIEIGVGSGRFAVPLGIPLGLDPSFSLLRMARSRGVEVIRGIAEQIPLCSETCGFALMMTSLCFVQDPVRACQETYRILKRGGKMMVGFLERGGEIVTTHMLSPDKGRFLRYARFYTGEDIMAFLGDAGFHDLQTLHRFRGFSVIVAEKPS
jgi:ubiquinone/menaquinone biosynthesis C-methylase UbiE